MQASAGLDKRRKRLANKKIRSIILQIVKQNTGRDYSIAIGDADEEDASHVLRLNLFAKTFEWKRYTLPIRTEEEGAPYWFGKALGKPRKATQWDSSKSGGEIDEGWLVIPILWYESLPGQARCRAGVYCLTKNKHLLNLQHVLFAPRSVELVPTQKRTLSRASVLETRRLGFGGGPSCLCGAGGRQGQGQGQGWCGVQSFPIPTRAEDALSVKVCYLGGDHKMASQGAHRVRNTRERVGVVCSLGLVGTKDRNGNGRTRDGSHGRPRTQRNTSTATER